MRMDVRIYIVKANSRGFNARAYIIAPQKNQIRNLLSQGSREFTHFAGKFGKVSRVQDRTLLGLRIYL